MDFREAEEAALAWMRRNEFIGARLTQGGADGGIDVISEAAVAQVKAEAKPTGRPAVQRIHGVATNQGCRALFFSTASYTSQAVDWADEAGVALFLLMSVRTVVPVNVHSQRIVDGRVASSKKTVAKGGVTLGRTTNPLTGTQIDLKFTIADCDSCGHDNAVAAGCQHCGATLPKEDMHVAARRRSVEGARARAGSASSATTSVTAGESFLEFVKARTIERQLDLVAEIDGADVSWESRYAGNIREFARIKARGLQSSSRANPAWTAVWPRVDRIFQLVAEVVEAYERSVTASTPELAASYADTAQRALDQLTAAANEYGLHVEQRNRAMDSGGAARNVSGCLSAALLALLSVSLLFSALIA